MTVTFCFIILLCFSRGRGGNAGFNAAPHGQEGEQKEGTDNGFISPEGGDDQAHRSSGRGGFRGGRGGGFRGAPGGGRQFDRHSGSDRTGVKGVEKKDGHGKGNWGTEAVSFYIKLCCMTLNVVVYV